MMIIISQRQYFAQVEQCNVCDFIVLFIVYRCAYMCDKHCYTSAAQSTNEHHAWFNRGIMQGMWHLCWTYRTCPAGLLGVPLFGQGIEEHEVRASEGVPLNSACVLHLVAWNTPANKRENLSEITRLGNFVSMYQLVSVTSMCVGMMVLVKCNFFVYLSRIVWHSRDDLAILQVRLRIRRSHKRMTCCWRCCLDHLRGRGVVIWTRGNHWAWLRKSSLLSWAYCVHVQEVVRWTWTFGLFTQYWQLH